MSHVNFTSVQISTDRITLTYRCTAGIYTIFHRDSVDVGWHWKGSVTKVPLDFVCVHQTPHKPRIFVQVNRHTDILTYSHLRNTHVEAARVPVHGHHNHLTVTTTTFRSSNSLRLWRRCRRLLSCPSCSARKVSLKRRRDRIGPHTL
jgi:hypothetical protein